jgi:hypothetical protein
MPEPESLTEEMVYAKWAEIAEAVEVITTRIQTPDEFAVEANSELAADDAASNPYQISHAARWCLNAGVDHLHALKSLVVDARRIHAYGSYGLVRGALENFGAGFWILHPNDPSIRIEHGLRWWMKNFRDQDTATRDRDLSNYKPLGPKLARITQIGKEAGCASAGLRDRYISTSVLEYATTHSTPTNPLLVWQACSGFAHGRPWAPMAMNEMQRGSDIAEGVTQMRFTTDHRRLLAITLPAYLLMGDLLRLIQDRAKSAV